MYGIVMVGPGWSLSKVPSQEEPAVIDVPFLLPHELLDAVWKAGPLQARGLEIMFHNRNEFTQ